MDVWIEQIKGKQVVLTLYCEKLLPLLKEKRKQGLVDDGQPDVARTG